MDCNAYSVLVDLSFQALGLGGLDQLTAGLSVFNPLLFEGLNTLTIKLDGGYPMTLTEDSCAVSAKNLAVGMKILLTGYGKSKHWFTITDIRQEFDSQVRITGQSEQDAAEGTYRHFWSENEARQQVLSCTQIPGWHMQP